MHITLVTPPSGFLTDQRVFYSLGILKVGAALEQAGHVVEHLDLSGVSNYEDVVSDYCKATETRVFGLTATTPQIPAVTRIAAAIRHQLPEAKLIIGGPHPTLLNAAAKGEHKRGMADRGTDALADLQNQFDVIVSGDGERAIFPALDASKGSLIDADDPTSPLWLTSKDFTESPWPARHLVDVDSYHYEIEGERAMHMIWQLGCPFECGFCGGRESYMLRRIRLRAIPNVIAEMESLHTTYGVRGMMAYDDEVNVNRQMVPLMYAIRDLGLKYNFTWKLRGFVKAELFTDEQAKALYAAGFRVLLCGFESAHPRVLRNINKKATLEDNTRMLRIAHINGLKVKALMSLGHPGESEETILATRDWLLAEKPDDFDMTTITTYAGTPYWDRAVPLGVGVYRYTIHDDHLYMRNIDFTKDEAWYKGIPGKYHSFVWTDYLSPERLVSLRDEVEDEVRTKLGLPYPSAPAAIIYEHSMGQSHIPRHILRGAQAKGVGA